MKQETTERVRWHLLEAKRLCEEGPDGHEADLFAVIASIENEVNYALQLIPPNARSEVREPHE